MAIENSIKNQNCNELFIKDDAGKLYINLNYEFLKDINNSFLFYHEFISQSSELETFFINTFIDETMAISDPKVGPLQNFIESQFYFLSKDINDFENCLTMINNSINIIQFRDFLKDQYTFFRAIIFSFFERVIDESKITDFIYDLEKIQSKFTFKGKYWDNLLNLIRKINNSTFPKKYHFYLFFFMNYYEECFINVLIDICSFNLFEIKFFNKYVQEFIESKINHNLHQYILNHDYREKVLILLITIISLSFNINIYFNIPTPEEVQKMYTCSILKSKDKPKFLIQNNFITFSTKLNYQDFFYYLFDLDLCYIYPHIFESIEKRANNYEENIYKLIKSNLKRKTHILTNSQGIKKIKNNFLYRVEAGSNLNTISTCSGPKSQRKSSESGKYSDAKIESK